MFLLDNAQFQAFYSPSDELVMEQGSRKNFQKLIIHKEKKRKSQP